jgi:selenide,water dikinase
MAVASGVTLEFTAAKIPLINGVLDLAKGNRPGGLASNLDYFERGIRVADTVDPSLLWLFHDPQTSGGLLISAAGEHARAVDKALMRAGVAAVEVGRAVGSGEAAIRVL